MADDAIIQVKQVTKRFPVGKGTFTALKDIQLTFRKAEFAGLVGPSGSGKTTMLNILGTLDQPSDGNALILGKSVAEMSPRQAAFMRNFHIGFIFQEYHLLPVYTVYENVEFALLLQKMGSAKRHQKVMDALAWVGLQDKAQSKPANLSGGESQRVAIARAMVKSPEILLADEPTANLDAKNAHHILQLMKQLNKELHTTFIFSTHDEKVMKYLDRIVSLEDGRVVHDQQQDHQTTRTDAHL